MISQTVETSNLKRTIHDSSISTSPEILAKLCPVSNPRMLPTLPYIFATLSIFFTQRSGVFAQQLSDTSGWALRGNQTCPAGESSCGKTAHGFVGCCPAFSPCLPQYNDVCCPPSKPQTLLISIVFHFRDRY